MACRGRAGYRLVAGEGDHHRVIATSAAVFHPSGASKRKRNIKLAAAAGMGYARNRPDYLHLIARRQAVALCASGGLARAIAEVLVKRGVVLRNPRRSRGVAIRSEEHTSE